MKICIACNKMKKLNSFYKHGQMKDGHLNKCIDCVKRYSITQHNKKSRDLNWVEKERTRGREKYHRLYVGIGKAKSEYNKKWIGRFPEKRLANLRSAKLKKPGYEKHHWSYHEKHWFKIIFLTKKDHMKAHRFLIYDQAAMMYRRSDNNELLNTKSKHLMYILSCIVNKPD